MNPARRRLAPVRSARFPNHNSSFKTHGSDCILPQKLRLVSFDMRIKTLTNSAQRSRLGAAWGEEEQEGRREEEKHDPPVESHPVAEDPAQLRFILLCAFIH